MSATIAIPNISAMLDAHLLAKREAEGEREIAGKCTWRASKLGSCLRAQYLEFFLKRPKFEEFDALTLRKFEVGHQWGRQFEEWFDRMFDAHEVKTEVELSDSSLDIGGHADFIVVNKDGPLGIELKSVNSRWFWYRAREKETTASPEHMMQAAVYSLLTLNQFPWIVLTVSKDDLTMEQDVVTEEHRRAALDKLELLNGAKLGGDPPQCTCLTGWEWKYCGYYAGNRKAPYMKGAKPDGDCCVI